MRALRGLLFAIAAAACAGWATGARAQCVAPANLQPLQIDIRVPQPRIVYHHDVDLFGLPKLEHHSEHPPKGWVVLGLTKISDAVQWQFGSLSVPTRDGRFCVWLSSVVAILGDAVINVYVASEYAEGTCEYDAILAHENAHVRFNLETLRDWAPTLRAALAEAAKKKFPAVFAAMPRPGELSAYLADNLRTVLARMGDDMAQRNATIDTAENYRIEHMKCSNWSRDGFRLDGK